MPSPDPIWTTLVLGLALGLAFGAVVERSHFCTMGAIADLALFGGTRRLRGWGMAIAVAVMAVALLRAAAPGALDGSIYLRPRLDWLPLLVGGSLFGFGMVLAGGCASRSLVRLGAGSVKALLVVVALSVSAAVTIGVDGRGDAAWLHLASIELASSPSVIELLGLPPIAAGAAGLALAGACLAAGPVRPARRELLAGLALGLLVAAGFIVSGLVPAEPVSAMTAASLTFVDPLARTALVAADVRPPALGLALVLGTVLGAAGSALLARRFRIEPLGGEDLVRHLVGGGLMGVGGALAGGCTVGQGMSGAATLALGSLLASGATVAGALWALRYLERGRLLPLPRRRAAGAGDGAW